MNNQPIDTAHDADLRFSVAAMRRAAQRARELAAQTGTAIVVLQHGVIQAIVPERAASAPELAAQEPGPTPYGGK